MGKQMGMLTGAPPKQPVSIFMTLHQRQDGRVARMTVRVAGSSHWLAPILLLSSDWTDSCTFTLYSVPRMRKAKEKNVFLSQNVLIQTKAEMVFELVNTFSGYYWCSLNPENQFFNTSSAVWKCGFQRRCVSVEPIWSGRCRLSHSQSGLLHSGITENDQTRCCRADREQKCRNYPFLFFFFLQISKTDVPGGHSLPFHAPHPHRLPPPLVCLH